VTLSQQRLETRLSNHPFRFFPQVDSTNDLAREWLLHGAAQGAAVIADEQVKGRGRKGRYWHTPPGVALAVSVILRPRPDALHQITMLGALAIASTLTALGAVDVGIKWPNDVLLKGRKVSGVLVEAAWDNDQLRGVVLGMGVNIRVDFTDTDLEQTAISIEPALGHPVDRADVLARLLHHVDTWTAKLGTTELFETWRSKLVTIGCPIIVHTPNGDISGTAEEVDREGALFVRDASHALQRIVAGDIEMG
jgi:BirA family transcriptional regulator, biotin operon repressor / biotin---[acetyl-CoA-carboxylase] ligase